MIMLVSIVTLSLSLMGPFTGIAITPISEIPIAYTSTDLTSDLEAALGVQIAEVTAIGSDSNMYYSLIAALDMEGAVVLAGYGGGSFYDITEDWNDYIGGDWTRVNAIQCYNDDWFVGGTKNDGSGDEAALVLICASCYGDGGDHEWSFSSPEFSGHTAVTGLSWDYQMCALGITTSGPAGMFTLEDPYGYDSGPSLDPVGDLMANATGPIATNGPSYAYDTEALDFVESGDRSVQSEPVQAMFYNTNWLTGTATGDALAYGYACAPQVYASLNGVNEVMSLDFDYDNFRWYLAGRGLDGYMKLFSDYDAPTEIATASTGPVRLNVPQTMTANINGICIYPYFLIGGTGGGFAHFYKHNEAAGLFIDLDYLVQGMNRINAIETGMGSFNINIARLPLDEVLVGGSGAKKLVLIAQVPAIFDSVPAGDGTIVDCPAGGAKVEVPAGAVNVDYSVVVEKVASGTPASPSGWSLLGTSYEFTCTDIEGNPITSFDQPVTITIYYNEADLNGMAETSLQIYWYNPNALAWEAVIPCVVDTANNTCTIQVSHFSQFGIMGYTESEMINTGK
jgi:hypothetical protein